MAALSSFSVCILLAGVCLTSEVGASEYTMLKQKYDVVLDEVADLRGAMMQMKEDMKMLNKVSKALNKLCAELHLPDSSPHPDLQEHEPSKTIRNGTNVHEEKDKEEDDDNRQHTDTHLTGPFQIYSLELTNRTFNIKYDGRVKEEVVYTERDDPILNMTSFETERLISTTKGLITGTVTPGDNYISIMKGHFIASVSFNANNQTPSEITFEPLEIKSDVQKNISFDPGHTTEFKVTFSKNDSFHFDLGMYTPSKDGIVLLVTSGSPGTVTIKSKKEYTEYNEAFITINGDQEDHEGLLYLSLSMYETDIQGLDHVYYGVNQLFEVRRSDHKDPFEVGYIGFVKNDNDHPYSNTRCTSETICALRAVLVGNMPENVTLWRIRGGKKIQLELPRNRGDFGRFMISVIFYLPTPSDDDEGKYIYRGTSHNRTVIEREFEVTVNS